MQPAIATTQHWTQVLTDYINTRYEVNLSTERLAFSHNPYYPVTPNVKVIDVCSTTDASNYAVFQIVPYDPKKYFNNVPLLVESLIPLTGADIIRELNERYSIVFDTEVDFTPEFLATEYTPDVNITVTFADTSFIWEGDLSIELKEPGKDIGQSVTIRDLEALLLPDVVIPGTQSLKLILWPTPIDGDTLRRQFSALGDIVIDDTLADTLMDICLYRNVLALEDIPDIRALLIGQTLVQHVDGQMVYRYTPEPLSSDRFTGTPVFHCTYLSDKVILDSLCSTIDMSQYTTPNSNWRPYTDPLNGTSLDLVVEVLNMQAQWVPADANGIKTIQRAIDSYGVSSVFSDYTRTITAQDYSQGYVDIELNANPSGPFVGTITIRYPLVTTALEGSLNGERVPLTSVTGLPLETKSATFTLTEEQRPLTSNNHLNTSPLGLITIINLSFINSDYSLRDTVTRSTTGTTVEYRSQVDTTPTIIEPVV